MKAHEVAQLALECLRFTRQRGDAFDLLARDAHSCGLWHCPQMSGDSLQLSGIVELAHGDLGLQLRGEDDEVDPQSVDEPSALVDERVAVIAQQPDLGSVLVEERDWEPLDPLTQHCASDRRAWTAELLGKVPEGRIASFTVISYAERRPLVPYEPLPRDPIRLVQAIA